MSDVKKLPKWAQDHIVRLERQRDMAIGALRDHHDHQTIAPFYTDELLCLGEQKGPSYQRRYFQGHTMTVEHAGVLVSVSTHEDEYIRIQYGNHGRLTGDTALIPAGHQVVRLIAMEKVKR